jgi:hypothetical protein
MEEGQGNNSFLGHSQLVYILQEGNSYSRRYETVRNRDLECPKLMSYRIFKIIILNLFLRMSLK